VARDVPHDLASGTQGLSAESRYGRQDGGSLCSRGIEGQGDHRDLPRFVTFSLWNMDDPIYSGLGPGQLTRALLRLPKERVKRVIVMEDWEGYLQYLRASGAVPSVYLARRCPQLTRIYSKYSRWNSWIPE